MFTRTYVIRNVVSYSVVLFVCSDKHTYDNTAEYLTQCAVPNVHCHAEGKVLAKQWTLRKDAKAHTKPRV
jgi:hypothetical protein